MRRPAPGGVTSYTVGKSAGAPYWVKLVRRGNLFTSYTSVDGEAGTISVPTRS